MSTSSSNTTRRLVLAGIGLLLFGCCFWSGLLGWLFAPFSPYMANWITALPGKAELVARAEWAPGGGRLSPDGRSMVLSWERDGPRELFIWDLTTNTRTPFQVNMSAMCWLDATQFAVFDGSQLQDRYYVVHTLDATIVPATLVAFKQPATAAEQAQVQARWQAADQIYVLDTLSYTVYTVFTIEDGQPIVYFLDQSNGQSNDQLVDRLLQGIPHTRIPDNCDRPGSDETGRIPPMPSPDGRLIAQWDTRRHRVVITDTEGRLRASVSKDGWDPYPLGWAHDSSGVYVQFMSRGSSAAVTMPWKPVVKLSPLTPQEAAISWITWLGGGAAVVAGVWWLRRWRRRRVTR